jgi:putative transposase
MWAGRRAVHIPTALWQEEEPQGRMVVSSNTSTRRLFVFQSSASAVSYQGEATGMRIVTNTTSAMRRLAKKPALELSRSARARLKYFDYYEAHDRNAALTCRYFGISRTTFYRWKARYNPKDLSSLEDHSSRPKRKRPKSWSASEIEAVRALREEHPRWGKDKLAVLLSRQGTVISVSRVGRILSYLKGRGVIHEPIRAVKARQRRWKRPFGVRKPREYSVSSPGDLVQLDTVELRLDPHTILHQFTARDLVSRYDVLTLVGRASSRTALLALDAIKKRMPFPVRAIQVDGGSEFMAEFEEECQRRHIRLFVLPPRSPKLNGAVERANRTHQEEFYQTSTAELTVAALGAELAGWEHIYNTIRPHQALGYLTPRQFLDNYYREHAREEEVSRR